MNRSCPRKTLLLGLLLLTVLQPPAPAAEPPKAAKPAEPPKAAEAAEPPKAAEAANAVLADGSNAGARRSVTVDITYPVQADGSQQPARYRAATGSAARPLLVVLHTWSGDYRQRNLPMVEAWCAEHNWHLIAPDFRGPATRPEAGGSESAMQDIVDAVAYASQAGAVLPGAVYLVGASGGGYHALLAAGRYPELWAGVSAWVPIYDLATWYHESAAKRSGYASNVVALAGGVPGSSAAVDSQLQRRSPSFWLNEGLPLRGRVEISAGVHDGHRGSVKISHSLRAFNALARPADRLSDEEIAALTERREVPASLQGEYRDPAFGGVAILFRRASEKVRVTIFDGGHQSVQSAILAWLEEAERKTGERR